MNYIKSKLRKNFKYIITLTLLLCILNLNIMNIQTDIFNNKKNLNKPIGSLPITEEWVKNWGTSGSEQEGCMWMNDTTI